MHLDQIGKDYYFNEYRCLRLKKVQNSKFFGECSRDIMESVNCKGVVSVKLFRGVLGATCREDYYYGNVRFSGALLLF